MQKTSNIILAIVFFAIGIFGVVFGGGCWLASMILGATINVLESIIIFCIGILCLLLSLSYKLEIEKNNQKDRHNSPYSNIPTLVLLVIMGLSCSSIIAPDSASADELDDVKNEISTKMEEVDNILQQIEDTETIANELQTQIDEKQQTIVSSQEKQSDLKRKLAQYASSAYRLDTADLLDLIFSSQDFQTLLKNLDYYNAIMGRIDSLVDEEKKVEEQLQIDCQSIMENKEKQDQQITQLQEQQSNLEAKIDELNNRKDELEEEQRSKLMQANSRADASGQKANTFASGDTSGWRTGVASAYGGWSDPYTPNPSGTATGAVCDDWSMGVAIPMAWDNYRSYFGRLVEISYNGQSVIATVNDCGGMGGGSRSLDLQPGVFKAFGCNTCDEWGLRTVSYRFL